MQSFTSRAGRRSLAQTILILTAAAALGACADDQPITAPSTQWSDPRVAADVGALETTDTTLVTVTIDRKADVFPSTGYGVLRGTVMCSRAVADTFSLVANVEQRQHNFNVVANVEKAITCTTSAQPWSLFLTPSARLERGKATATVRILDAPPGVVSTPTSRTVLFTQVVQ